MKRGDRRIRALEDATPFALLVIGYVTPGVLGGLLMLAGIATGVVIFMRGVKK